MENQFFVDSEYLSEKALRKKAPPGNRSFQQKKSYGISSRYGGDPVRGVRQSNGTDGKL